MNYPAASYGASTTVIPAVYEAGTPCYASVLDSRPKDRGNDEYFLCIIKSLILFTYAVITNIDFTPYPSGIKTITPGLYRKKPVEILNSAALL